MIKKESIGEITRTGHTFTVTVNEATDSLSAEALAAYHYLMGKPADWTIRVADVCKRFGWGAKGTVWRRVARELRAAGLLYDQITRSADGRNIIARQLCCASIPRVPGEDEVVLGVEDQHPRENVLDHENQHPRALGVESQQARKSTPLLSTEYLLSTPSPAGLRPTGVSTTECGGLSVRLEGAES